MVEPTITDVRIALNNITPEELTDDAIQQKIDDGKYWSGKYGLVGDDKDRFVRAWAAWRSFLISRSYQRAKIGLVQVDRNLGMIADALKQEAEEIINDASDSFKVVSTPMFDNRPEDPFYTGEEDVDQTEL